jgi:hypothetical protein
MNSPLLADHIGEAELAQQLNIGLRTLRSWRTNGIGPPITYIGRKPYFHRESVRGWLKSRERPMPRQDKRRRKAETAR